MQRNKCQDTSPGLPAETHNSIMCPVCSLRPSSFILALALSFLGYNSKIVTGSQGTFEISSFAAPGTLHSWKAQGPRQPTHKLHTLACPPLLNSILRAGSLHLKPDSQTYQFHGPLSCQMKIFPSLHTRILSKNRKGIISEKRTHPLI